VRKHSSNIHFNIKVQVHSYHREWYNIAGILHHQRIQKYDLQRDIHNKSWEVLTSSKRGLESQLGEELGRRATVTFKLPLRYSDRHGRIRYAPHSNIWTYGSRIVRYNPTSTRDGVNSMHIRHTCTRKVCREYKYIWTWNETVSKNNYRETSYTNTHYRSVRLVRRRNNPNKKALIYIPYTSRHCNLSLYNVNCLHNNRIRKQYGNAKISNQVIQQSSTGIICKWWAG